MRTDGALLRNQLLAWLLIPLAVLLVLDAWVSYGVALRAAEKAYDRSLVELARELVLQLRDGAVAPRLDAGGAPGAALRDDPTDDVFFEVDASDGRILFGQPIPGLAGADGAAGAERLYDTELGDAPVRVVELAAGSPSAGPLRVRVAETKIKRNAMAREIVIGVVAPQILLILVAGAVVWAGVVRGLSPLERLQRQVASRSHLDLSPVEEGPVPGEVRPLVASINALLARLDKVLTLQSRFIADAAHQLKTPVAALTAQIELLTRETDPARQREATGRICVGVERLSRLVSQLLALARNEPEAIRSIAFRPLDLNGLALEASADWVPESLERRIDLGFEGADAPVLVNGEAARLRELLDNLLDNAIRYSRDGGRVTVRVWATPRPTISISDDGPSIPETERERVFQRFHRLLDEAGEGTGLGLAIALEIAHIHGAQIRLQDDADGIGNTFTVSFPPVSTSV